MLQPIIKHQFGKHIDCTEPH